MPSSLRAAPATPLRDLAFTTVFPRLLVYTILFEDNEPDLEFLAPGEEDRVFTVASAGCGVAALLASAPARIDVVDFNRAHLALTALKVSAARSVASYGEFHDLLALGRHPRPREAVGALARDLPPPLAAYWRTGWKMFRDGLYAHGLLRRNLDLLWRLWPISPEYLRSLNARPPEERVAELEPRLRERLGHWALAALLNSPVALLAAGINYTQRDRNLRAVGTDSVAEALLAYARRIARTDLEGNWIAWHIATGGFNLDRPASLPVYLREEHHRRSVGAPTEVRYRHGTLLDALAAAPDGSWSRFCLSDVVDWKGPRDRARLFAEVHRTARPGARVVCRTVEDSAIVDELGMADRFRLVEPASAAASARERSCLYRRVNLYEVLK